VFRRKKAAPEGVELDHAKHYPVITSITCNLILLGWAVKGDLVLLAKHLSYYLVSMYTLHFACLAFVMT
jgi:hypothetical protein